MTVTLSPLEYTHAALAGFLRQAENVALGRQHAHGYDGFGFDTHILGALGEFAVAKALGMFWAGPGTLRGADVGTAYQVRATRWLSGRLCVHPPDEDAAAFILVIVHGLKANVRGWMYGREAKERKWWESPQKDRPAFYVPQGSLHPIETLPGARKDGAA